MKHVLRIGLSIGVSFAILAILLNMVTAGVADEQRPSIYSTLQATSLTMVMACFCIYLIGLLLRAYRYRLLIGMSGEQNTPTFSQMVLVTGVRNMVVDMLPARLGELGYVALLNRGYGVKLQHCVSSLTIAVALDFVALLIVVVFVVFKQIVAMGSAASLEGWVIAALLVAFILAAIAVIGLFVITPFVSRWLNARFVASKTIFGKLLSLLEQFSQSLLAVRAAGQAKKLIILSVLIRILKYFGLFILFRAVAVPSFEVFSQLPFEKIVSALIGGEIGASLPIPTFMSFGAYEAGSALVFQLLGVGQQAAVVITMLCVHIWSQLMEYILGALFLVTFILLNRRAKKMSDNPMTKQPRRLAIFASYLLAGIVFVGGSFTFAYQLWAASKLGSLSAPAAGEVSADASEWRELSKQHVSSLNGFVVFSSNRDGNHDIFKLNLADYELTKLTTHPNTETYPRISPDGTKLVFARGHETWVSQRNTVAWDVYVLDLNTLEEQRVGTNGTAPQWINQSHISYLQDTSKVVKVNVNSLQSDVIYQTGVNNPMPAGSAIQNPEYSAVRDQFVFTARQSNIGSNTGHWGTAITSGKTHRGAFNGCELAWDYSGQKLFQVNPGGKFNDLQIISVDPETLEQSLLIDLEGEFSHEYWPKDSSNGQYMVFGASRSRAEHEHDVADYEIFLWKVGSDSSQATRLTFHTGNDNWPDVYVE